MFAFFFAYCMKLSEYKSWHAATLILIKEQHRDSSKDEFPA